MASVASAAHTVIRCADRVLDLTTPKIMGILNLTPDSFYAESRCSSKETAKLRVAAMIEEGADIIDIGAESSRPYAKTISLQEEIDRILETLEVVKQNFDVILSVDTYKAKVMQEAIKLGVHMINDIYALTQPNSLLTIANSNVAICLMHMQGSPNTMQDRPHYHAVVPEVSKFLSVQIDQCLAQGIDEARIIIDPGFGFGKTTPHNMTLLKNLAELKRLGYPLLVGLSRKASIGELLNLPIEERMYGSLAAHIIASMQGANIIRTHDIKPTAHALKILTATFNACYAHDNEQ